MKINPNKEIIKELLDLSSTRINNSDIISMYAEYLIEHSTHINKKLITEFNKDLGLSEEEAYYYLFLAACGFDIDKYENHRELAKNYIRPSIKKLDTEKYLNNPYYKNIKIPNKKIGKWELKEEAFQPYEAFLYDDIFVDESFREIPRLGFFRESFTYPAVLENNNEWMTITPSEIESSQEAIEKAFGKVITYGLGLGYYAYMVSEKENVESITIIERDKDVISLFESYILPQFPQKEKVRIINCDALLYDPSEEKYDFAFVDLWHDAGDGFELYLKMKQREVPNTKYSYWIEESLLTVLRKHVFLEMLHSLSTSHSGDADSHEAINKFIYESTNLFMEENRESLEDQEALEKYQNVVDFVKERLKNVTITSPEDIRYYLSDRHLSYELFTKRACP